MDWGQDFYRLQDWSVGRHPAVAYFGPRGLDRGPGPGRPGALGAYPLDRLTGWVAVSATRLTTSDHAALSWLRAYCPLGTLGGSILLYRFARPPDTAPGPIRPAAACPSGTSFSARPPAPRPG